MLTKILTALVATTMLISALGTSPSFAGGRGRVGQFGHQAQAYCAN